MSSQPHPSPAPHLTYVLPYSKQGALHSHRSGSAAVPAWWYAVAAVMVVCVTYIVLSFIGSYDAPSPQPIRVVAPAQPTPLVARSPQA